MNDTITISGLVATEPRVITTNEKLHITSFRLASTQRRYSKAHDGWIDGDTNWYTITSFRKLAVNVAGSVNKGDRVVVTGKLRIRSWEAGEKSGTTIEIDADSIGHDLAWGTSSYVRTMSSSESQPAASTEDSDVAADASAQEFPSESASGDALETELRASSQVATPF